MTSWKRRLKGVWRFIWEDDSILSWLVNIVLAFILIKYLVFPGLGLLLGTSHPVVAVVSGSMEHDGDFGSWWQSGAVCGTSICTQQEWYNIRGITEEEFKRFIFRNGFNTGDIIVLTGADMQEIDTGEVIVFQDDKPYPIIHRVVAKKLEEGEVYLQTKGDHNPDSGPNDLNITEEQVIGKALFRIPYLGWIKIVFFEFLEIIGITRLIG